MSTSYRPDIDGLRTVAVLPVILFHAGVPGFSGGYVGVDVFFVISGYLISGILLADLRAERYSIARFYERRVRRIFPALATVVGATLIAGIMLLTPASLAEVGRSALAVALFASNFFFWKSVDYFADAHAIHPLLHTWSLAVEEQFYILFPPLLAFLVRRRWPVVAIFAGLALLSFLMAAALVLVKPSATFYLPFTRAWELLAGVLLAAGAASRPITARAREIGGMAGLAMILLPIFLYTSRTPFPGVAALPPVIGTVLVIWSGAEGRTRASRLLAARVPVSLGLLSYSLYLWHVPIFAYLAFVCGGIMPLSWAPWAILANVALAWLSYRFVETPVRRGQAGAVRRPVLASVAAMTITIGAAGALVASAGWPSRLDAHARLLVDAAADKDRMHRECLSVGEIVLTLRQACVLGDRHARPKVMLWGDSHAMVTAAAMEAYAGPRHRAFLFSATADCPIGIGFEIDGGTESGLTHLPSYRACGSYNREMLARAIGDPAITRVVLSSRWTNWRIGEPANPAESSVDIRLRDATGVAGSVAANAVIFERGFLALVQQLRSAGKQVFVVGPVPEPSFNVPERLFAERYGVLDPAGPVPVSRYQQRHRRILSFFSKVERARLATFIWPARELCQHSRCPIAIHDRPAFFDHNHLSLTAAQRTAPLYAQVFL